MDRFEHHYRLLQLKPGDSWERLRASYKSQIRQWHPDRFMHDRADRHRAEEHSKQINQAYQELVDYYSEHGRLPLDPPPPPPVETERPGAGDPTAEPATFGPRSEPARPTRRAGTRRRFILGLGLAAIMLYLFWGQSDIEPGRPAAPAPDTAASPKPAETPAAGSPLPGTRAASFEVGSTLGEVYAIQGVPTRVEGDTWYYGDAQVRFENGKVVRWTDTEPPRLKASRGLSTPPAAKAAVFDRGSTREEVRAIQGAPLRDAGNVWEYGLSRVYFDRNGLVNRWEESPLDPLHVPH